jgi:membrane protein implicated in regulation of membrane protease activity
MKFIATKPDIFWLIMAVAILALVLGVPGVLLAVFTKSEIVTKIVIFSILLFWVLGVVLTIVYWIRQLLGRYEGGRHGP